MGGAMGVRSGWRFGGDVAREWGGLCMKLLAGPDEAVFVGKAGEGGGVSGSRLLWWWGRSYLAWGAGRLCVFGFSCWWGWGCVALARGGVLWL